MTTNVKVAQNVSSDGAIITGFRYVDTNTSLGDEGTGSSPTSSRSFRSLSSVRSTKKDIALANSVDSFSEV